MAKVEMNCPRCGKEATEYNEKKWQCLHCGCKFLYDPNAPEKEPAYKSFDFMGIACLTFMMVIMLSGFIMVYLESKETQKTERLKLQLEIQRRIEQAQNPTNSIPKITETP